MAWKRKRLKKDRPPDSGREDSEQAAKFREEQRKPPNPEGMTARKRKPSKVGGWCASRYPRDKDSA